MANPRSAAGPLRRRRRSPCRPAPSAPLPRAGARPAPWPALAGVAALALPAVAWAPPTPPDTPPPGAAKRGGPETWPICGGGVFLRPTKGIERHGKAGGMSVSVLWKNLSYTTFLPVTLKVDSVEKRTVLRPRQTLRMAGAAHFVFGDHRRYPEFTWTVNAFSPSDVVFLNYTVQAARCRGSAD